MNQESTSKSKGQLLGVAEEVYNLSLVGYDNPSLENSPLAAALLGVKSSQAVKIYSLPSSKSPTTSSPSSGSAENLPPTNGTA